MSVSNGLIMLIFIAIGYVAHPVVLPLLGLTPMEEEVEQAAAQPAQPMVVPATKIETIEQPTIEPPVSLNPTGEKTAIISDQVTNAENLSDTQKLATTAEVSAELNQKTIDQQVIDIMQKTLQSGEVAALKHDAVKSWRFGGREIIDGDSYDIGLITIDMVTILGTQQRKVKALCKDGVIVKWVYAASGATLN